MHKVRAKKHLGQHFLKNPAQAQRLAEALSGEGYQQVLEIGPGMGVLTQFLLQGSAQVRVAEIDVESVRYLEQHFPQLAKNIIPGDVLQLDWSSIMGQKSFALVGNYPYNISSQIIFKMLSHRTWIPEMVGMFQKEVAERLVAPPGSKTYGILSVLCAAYYDREYLFTLEPEEFRPAPKVRSGVIRMRRKEPEAQAQCEPDLLIRVVKTAFNQRRKTLRNALKALNLPLQSLPPSLLQKRAEQLSYLEFVALTESLYP